MGQNKENWRERESRGEAMVERRELEEESREEERWLMGENWRGGLEREREE